MSESRRKSLMRLTKEVLRLRLMQANLVATGNKKNMVQRLLAQEASAPARSGVQTSSPGEFDSDELQGSARKLNRRRRVVAAFSSDDTDPERDNVPPGAADMDVEGESSPDPHRCPPTTVSTSDAASSDAEDGNEANPPQRHQHRGPKAHGSILHPRRSVRVLSPAGAVKLHGRCRSSRTRAPLSSAGLRDYQQAPARLAAGHPTPARCPQVATRWTRQDSHVHVHAPTPPSPKISKVEQLRGVLRRALLLLRDSPGQVPRQEDQTRPLLGTNPASSHGDQVKEDILVWCATRQPFRPKTNTFTPGNTSAQRSSTTGGQPTQSSGHITLSSTGKEICRRYNYGTCTRTSCTFAHKCWITEFERELRNHPDKAWVSWLLQSILNGVSTGYKGPHTPYTARNLSSALQYPDVITSELQKEVAAGRVLGPFADRPLPSLRTSGLGAAAKKQGKRRMILHLSAPYGASVNDGISKEEFSLHYSSVDNAVKLLHSYGKGAIMAKVDLKAAFRMVPVRAADWGLIGVEAIHYLGDFLISGAAGRDLQCAASVRVTLSVCEHLGVPVAFDKLEGPSTQITFLGILLDSEALTLSLPQEKLAEILLLVQSWLSRRRASKRELLSFIGKLSFAAKVVPAGCLFLRRLIDLSTTVAKFHHHIRVTADTRADVAWWARFLPSWNGVSMFFDHSWTDADTLNLFTNASGTLGFGAYFDGSWFKGSWLPHQELSQRSIQWQELFAIVAAAHTWGHRLAGRRIRFHCDNLAVVHAWNGQSSRDTAIMVLLRELFYVAARSNFTVQLVHVPGKHNSLADALSRDMLSRFFHTCSSGRPSTNSHASGISRSLDRDLVSGQQGIGWVYHCHIQGWDSAFHHILQTSGRGRSPIYQASYSPVRDPPQLLPPPAYHPGLLGRCLLSAPGEWPQEPCGLPITPKILQDLIKQLHCDSTITQHDKLMLQAAMLLAFFGFLRVSEFTTPAGSTSRFLAKGDVKFMDHQLKVFLSCSKTDQLGKGSTITPLFHFRHGPPLTARKFRAVLHFYLKSLGLKSLRFNTHSFRIGAATAAAKAGLQSSTLKELGRWHSAAFHSYPEGFPNYTGLAAKPGPASLLATLATWLVKNECQFKANIQVVDRLAVVSSCLDRMEANNEHQGQKLIKLANRS
eukprot:Em0019g980a